MFPPYALLLSPPLPFSLLVVHRLFSLPPSPPPSLPLFLSLPHPSLPCLGLPCPALPFDCGIAHPLSLTSTAHFQVPSVSCGDPNNSINYYSIAQVRTRCEHLAKMRRVPTEHDSGWQEIWHTMSKRRHIEQIMVATNMNCSDARIVRRGGPAVAIAVAFSK